MEPHPSKGMRVGAEIRGPYLEPKIWEVPDKRGAQNGTQCTLILMIGTPKMGLQILGSPYMDNGIDDM